VAEPDVRLESLTYHVNLRSLPQLFAM
jgi:hypothetical protein